MEPMLVPHEQQELSSSRNRRTLLFNLIVLLIVFVAVTFVFPNGSHKNLFTWGETELLIHCPDEVVYTVPYREITHITLWENADTGTCLQGDSTSTYRYGQWENELLGSYYLCAYRSFGTLIRIETPADTYCISYESAETTTGLYNSIVTTLSEEGYLFETQLP